METGSQRRSQDQVVHQVRDRHTDLVALKHPGGVNLISLIGFCAILLAGGAGAPERAEAQVPKGPPSVMDRIQEKARQRQPAPPGDWFQRLDTNRDNRISRQELQASVNRRFGLLDANRDGRVSRQEFQARKIVPGQTGPSFDQMDVDRNGTLSGPEFAAPVLWRFARLDSDGDGFLSRAETARYLNTPSVRSLPPLSGRCFEIDGRYVIVSPERADDLEKSGRAQIDCSWQPGGIPAR